MKITRVLLALLAAGSFSAQAADPVTYYVNSAMENDDGDGKSPATAKKYIQSAVDLCSVGDTVSVTNGVYRRASEDDAQVVSITKKIYLTGAGRDVTTIDGENAVRGVLMAAGVGAIVRGFTVCNCKALDSVMGAGIRMPAGYAVDCIISNCTVNYRGGGLGGGVALRCKIDNCFTGDATNPYGTAAGSTDLLNCLIVGNSQYRYLLHAMAKVVNCTIANNGSVAYGYRSSSYLVLNTICAENQFTSFYSSSKSGIYAIATNCLVSSGCGGYSSVSLNVVTAPDNIFAAPALGDYRPTSTSGAANLADAEILKVIPLPEELEDDRYLDYLGQPIAKSGKITAGAIQEVYTPAADETVLKIASPYEFEGRGVAKFTYSDCGYLHVSQVPIKFRPVGAAITNYVWSFLNTNGVRYAYAIPDRENWAVTVPVLGSTNSLSKLVPTKVLYADPVNGDDTYEGDDLGSAEHPYKTLQAAIDATPNGNGTTDAKLGKSVIVAKPGEYKEGLDSSNVSRMHIYNRTPGATSGGWWYKTIRLVAEAGAEQTAIVGGAGVRCVYSEYPSLVQGFTLTGASGTLDGLAIRSSAVGNCYLADCVISNNTVSSDNSLAFRSTLMRTIIRDNKCSVKGGADVYGSRLANCEVVHASDSASGTLAVSGVAAYPCTLLFSAIKGTIDTGDVTVLGSIVSGGQIANDASYDSCFAQGEAITGTGSIVNCRSGKAGCVNFSEGDFRLKSNSKALGFVTIDSDRVKTYRQIACTDLNGDVPAGLTALTAGPRQAWSVEALPLLLLFQ